MFKVLITFLLIQSSAFANSMLDTFDIKSYSPIKKGLKDMYFEVRNNKIKAMVETSTGVKLKEDPYFEVYWKFPKKIEVKIQGMPKGFVELHQNLKKVGYEVIDYVIPRSPKDVFKEFSFKQNGNTLNGKSKSGDSRINEVVLDFNNGGLLTKMTTLSPYSRSETDFKYSVKKGSDNKYLTDELNTTITRGKVKLKLEKNFEYISQDGFVLPSLVKIKMRPLDKKGGNNQSNISEMKISNYKVNEGYASKKLGK